jgi:protein TonB
MFTTAIGVKEGSGRFFRTTIAASVGLHVAAGTFFVVASFWKITRLSPKAQELIFQPLASPSTSPPESAAAAPSAPVIPKHPNTEPVAPRHEKTMQPADRATAMPAAAPDEGGPGTDEPAAAPGGGLGDASNTVGSVIGIPDIGATQIQIPPPPVVAPPQMVDRREIEGQRVAGDPQIRLSDDIVAMLDGQGVEMLAVSVRLCIDEAGVPSSIRFTPGTGFERVEQTIRSQMSTWRYRPWMVNGQAMRVCFPVLFKYRITQ